MYSIDQINDLKQSVKIVEYLESRGYKPETVRGNELLYFSPLSGETGTPSFSVNVKGNVFNDFSFDEKGDVIRLCMLLEIKDFSRAVRSLLQWKPTDLQDYATINAIVKEAEERKKEPCTISRVKEITSPSLIRYLESRAIPLRLAKNWINEIHYNNSKGNFFGLGFRNDSGGFSVRSAGNYKGIVGANDIRSINVNASNENVFLFEGFFDYISFLRYHNKLNLSPEFGFFNLYVTNSTSLINRLPDFSDKENILCYFDNDPAGRRAFIKLKERYGDKVVNQSQILYPGNNDFNDFLISQISTNDDKKTKDKKRLS